MNHAEELSFVNKVVEIKAAVEIRTAKRLKQHHRTGCVLFVIRLVCTKEDFCIEAYQVQVAEFERVLSLVELHTGLVPHRSVPSQMYKK